MSKIVAGTAFVLLSGATVTGGVLLLNKGSKSENENKTETEQVDADITDTLDKFKNDGHQEGCVTSTFGTVTSFSSVTALNGEWDSSYSTFFSNDEKTQGCLVVNWDKKSKSEVSGSNTTVKWNGNFRFLWAVKGDSKGFVVYLLGKPKKDTGGSNHKFSWSGIGYVMEKDATTSTWSAKKSSATQTGSGSSSIDKETTKFPKAKTSLPVSAGSSALTEFWGLFSQANDLGNVEEDSNLATGTQSSSMKGYWKWDGQQKNSPASDKKLSDWTSNWDTWWTEIFDSNKFKLKDVIDKQEGTWTNAQYLPPAVASAS